MHYSNIKNCDIANGIGVRVSLFVSGCNNHCHNCFQPETWDFNHGPEFTTDIENKIIDMLDKNYINGLTILGGEPLDPRNQPSVYNFVKRVRNQLPDKNIWCYTGFLFEDLMNVNSNLNIPSITEPLLRNIDVLVDGRFVEELKKLTLKFRGSSNQRLIDLKKTFENNEVTLLDIQDRKI